MFQLICSQKFLRKIEMILFKFDFAKNFLTLIIEIKIFTVMKRKNISKIFYFLLEKAVLGVILINHNYLMTMILFLD